MQIDKQGHDGAGQQPPQIVQQRGFAHATLAVQQQRRLAAIQQKLLNPAADVGTPDKNLLLLGQRHADDVRAVNLLAQFCFLGQPLQSVRR